MSTHLLETEIRRFLASRTPEVICVTGRWGVGKTYAWKKFLKDARIAGSIALPHYSYVSLFGISCLDDLKYAIFENLVRSSNADTEPNLETFKANLVPALQVYGKKSLRFVQQLPIVKNYLGSIGPAWFLSVRETIICIDDIERRGKNLELKDLLGLLSNLTAQRECKVVLILNDEALEEGSQQDFQKYFEKVVDAKLHFAPSPSECVEIALIKDTESRKLLAENCIALGISNIRVIKKIERSIGQVEPLLVKYEKSVLKQAVQSLALFGWSVYEPDIAPY